MLLITLYCKLKNDRKFVYNQILSGNVMSKPKIPQRQFCDLFFVKKTLPDGSIDADYMIRDQAVDFLWRVFLRDYYDVNDLDFISIVGINNTSFFQTDIFLGPKTGHFWIGWDLNYDNLPERCKGIKTLKSQHIDRE